MDHTNVLVLISDHQRTVDDAISFSSLAEELEIYEDEELQLGEELDYLLMSGIISGDDDGYELSDKWWDELTEEDRNGWLNCSGKSAIIDPVIFFNKNPRNFERARYAWEDNVYSSFRFGLLPPEGTSLGKIAIVSGRCHNPLIRTVDAHAIRERIEPCLDGGQSLYHLNMLTWSDVEERLLAAGIYGLMIDYLDVL
jgi:hypothetical protein